MAYTYGKDAVKKHNYDLYLTKSASYTAINGTIPSSVSVASHVVNDLATGWVKIGALGESPAITTSEGDTVAIAEGNELVLSGNVELSAEILQVTKDNWEELRSAQNEEVDAIMVDTDCGLVCASDGGSAFAATELTLKSNLEITGNDTNKITLTAAIETDDVTGKMKFVELTDG